MISRTEAAAVLLREALQMLDDDGEHIAAAYVSQAIEIISPTNSSGDRDQ